jgi:serine/threonine-protein kinase HipA
MLDVHLYGLLSATIDRDRRGRIRLAYTDEALAELGRRRRWLSLNLPTTDEPYVGMRGAVPFVEGLLPEGEAVRSLVAERLGVDADDDLALLAAIGRDAAGAVAVVPEGEPAVSVEAGLQPIDADDVGHRLRRLPREPLSIDAQVRLSLGGAQPKMLLTRANDRWNLPIHGAPSTHILKPSQDDRFPGLVANEAFCMRLLRHAGLPAAQVAVHDFGGVETLVIERFDRQIRDGGRIERLHQEDAAGALGVRPRDKYLTNAKSGVTYQRIAGLLDQFASRDDLRNLARLVTANVALGNADAHGRNYGLLLSPDGTVRLAPAYDVVCTLAYAITSHSIAVDGAQQHSKLSTRRVVDEVRAWGLPAREAEALVRDTLARLADAVEPARDETPELADSMLRHIRANLLGPFRAETDFAPPPQLASDTRTDPKISPADPQKATAPRCGAWMPRAQTYCRRRPGHAGPHRRT